ncbi:MAG TPA: YciI family protein [Spirochaetia bacterium]|nr:YciI family protein [Spirochaetia bacterium]
MRFLLIQTPDPEKATPPSKELYANMQKLVERETEAGILVMTGGISPLSRGGARVRQSGRKFSVVEPGDSREVTGGFAIVDVPSREEAIEAARRFFEVAGDGEAEIHQIG